VLFGLLLAGCMQATLEPASEANFTPRDKKAACECSLRAQAQHPHRPISATLWIITALRRLGRFVIDTDARYLYYVLPEQEGHSLRA